MLKKIDKYYFLGVIENKKKEKTLYGILCGAGGVLIGSFANKLSTMYGGALFAIGVSLLVFSTLKLNK